MKSLAKQIMVCATLIVSVGLSQSSLAAYWVHASQCSGTAKFSTEAAYSGAETGETKLVCWVDVSRGYGDILEVKVTYAQNPGRNSEGLACKATSYRASGSIVHSTSTVKKTGATSQNESLIVKDSSASGKNDAALARIECTLPPNYTDPRSGGTPSYGSFVYRIKVW